MRKIKIIKGVKDYKEGQVYEVNVNEAFSLIDAGYAKPYKTQVVKYKHRMMIPQTNKK